MGEFERDAKKLVRDLGDSNRANAAWFYGFFIVLAIIGGIVAGVRAMIHDVPWQTWATFGGGLGVLALVVLLVVVANRRVVEPKRRRPPKPKRGSLMPEDPKRDGLYEQWNPPPGLAEDSRKPHP